MAKIAVELEQAVARRAARGGPGGLSSRVLAQGEGWHVADMTCTCGPQDRRFEEQHPFFTVAVVLAGTFQYRGSLSRSGSVQELMTPGSLLLGNAGQCFECGHEHGLGDRCISFRYSPDYFERLAADAAVVRGRPNFSVLRLPALQPLSGIVARASAGLIGARDTYWEELSMQLAAETMELTNGQSPKGVNPTPSTVARVTRAVRMIERKTDMELSLRDLAREAGLSPYHFLRTFQQVTGVTPHQYIRRMRLREAAARLAAHKDKILDIALDSGFGDVSNFNRAFRAEFGVPPRTHRAGADR
ncbi:MAG TPA: AraC family transcriptional regulator [Candidatus Acidoferrum sp.]|nr:AraC family transcriptional regulator [Candidatus Acidoferrum sp.]